MLLRFAKRITMVTQIADGDRKLKHFSPFLVAHMKYAAATAPANFGRGEPIADANRWTRRPTPTAVLLQARQRDAQNGAQRPAKPRGHRPKCNGEAPPNEKGHENVHQRVHQAHPQRKRRLFRQ